MAGTTRRDVMKALVDTRGRTYAQEAGIRLKNTPQPLYQLLVLADLLSARISADVAVAAAKELSAAGMRDPRRMADATWQERVDALGRGGYRRYDERTARQLGDGAEMAQQRYGGDLRKLRDEADGDLDAMRTALQKFPGVGPAGADIFLREAQAVWPEAAPYFDDKAMAGARALDLPTRPEALLKLTGDAEPAVLAAALVRVALDKKAPEAVREAAHA
jgi:endonuclease III